MTKNAQLRVDRKKGKKIKDITEHRTCANAAPKTRPLKGSTGAALTQVQSFREIKEKG